MSERKVSAKLVFGETRLRGIYASKDNPQRDGTYVESVTRQGERCVRLTDGEGAFWEYPLAYVAVLTDHELMWACSVCGGTGLELPKTTDEAQPCESCK